MPPVPYLHDSLAIVPINLASSKKATCSCLVHFSTTLPCRIWPGLARELKLEGLSALLSYFLLYFVRRFVSVLGTVIFWSF